MTYEELKKLDKRAHSALITLWEELSRVSRETSQKGSQRELGALGMRSLTNLP